MGKLDGKPGKKIDLLAEATRMGKHCFKNITYTRSPKHVMDIMVCFAKKKKTT